MPESIGRLANFTPTINRMHDSVDAGLDSFVLKKGLISSGNPSLPAHAHAHKIAEQILLGSLDENITRMRVAQFKHLNPNHPNSVMPSLQVCSEQSAHALAKILKNEGLKFEPDPNSAYINYRMANQFTTWYNNHKPKFKPNIPKAVSGHNYPKPMRQAEAKIKAQKPKPQTDDDIFYGPYNFRDAYLDVRSIPWNVLSLQNGNTQFTCSVINPILQTNTDSDDVISHLHTKSSYYLIEVKPTIQTTSLLEGSIFAS